MRFLLFIPILTLTAAAFAAQSPPTDAVIPSLKGFPAAVWLQDPSNAEKYRGVGINLFVGLWDGPTDAQLASLEKAGMPVICEQNAEGLKPRWKDEIVAWMQSDEPDNAQSLPDDKGYGPPITPQKVLETYRKIKATDPSRPVILNLGQGVAWDGWFGRGVRTNKPEDYPLYSLAGDILSFDIYPVTHSSPEVSGKLSFVARGTERLAQWSDHKKPVWACIETTHIDNPDKKPTPAQVRSEVWLAIIHGARGIIYFAHEFKPKFVEAGLLRDKPMANAVKQINSRLAELAPAINSPEPALQAIAQTADGKAAPIAVMTRQISGTTYIFSVNTSDATVAATLSFPGATQIEVLDESRQITPVQDKWVEEFTAYEVHLYRIPPTK